MQGNSNAKSATGDILDLPRRFSEVVESFYLETVEGLFFAVKGLEHPQDRWISVLRFVPDPDNGKRNKAGVRYRRLYHFKEQEQFLHSSCPKYLTYDPVFQTTLQSVPKAALRRIYDPRSRFKEITEAPSASAIEEDAAEFGKLLQRESGVPSSAIGVSGSLLIGLHTDSSDLDMSVFGTRNCRGVHQALQKLLASGTVDGPRRLDAAGIELLYSQRVTDTHMPFNVFAASEKNKVCQGSFRGRPYFIRFIREANEAKEKYGAVRYTPLGRAAITAMIADDEESIFTPCRYVLTDARIVEGPELCIDEIVSFRGRFCEQARTGDAVRASGTVERLDSGHGETHYRLLLGNSSRDAMIVEYREAL